MHRYFSFSENPLADDALSLWKHSELITLFACLLALFTRVKAARKGCGFKIIGSAHNINEIKIKEKQNCEYIFLSPLFKTNKHKYYLDIVKFNLISNATKRKIVCLGGINSNNLKKINLTKSKGIASISWIKKKRPK